MSRGEPGAGEQERGPGADPEVGDGQKRRLGCGMAGAEGVQGGGSSSLTPSWSTEGNVDPTDAEPIEPNPIFSLSGRSAMALVIAGNLGILIVIAGMGFTIIQSQRYLVPFTPVP